MWHSVLYCSHNTELLKYTIALGTWKTQMVLRGRAIVVWAK